jgi:hypothetical protein
VRGHLGSAIDREECLYGDRPRSPREHRFWFFFGYCFTQVYAAPSRAACEQKNEPDTFFFRNQATGYDCSCDMGFVFDGITCSDLIFANGFDE